MLVDAATHRKLAVDANNSTWEILGKPVDEILHEEGEEMVRRAYAAAYHWQRAEGAVPANEVRASWLLSRVWVVLSNGTLALHYAQRCLSVCESSGLTGFDLAYAHEALARSYACLGETQKAHLHLDLAKNVHIEDAEDRAIVESDLASAPWFNLSQ